MLTCIASLKSKVALLEYVSANGEAGQTPDQALAALLQKGQPEVMNFIEDPSVPRRGDQVNRYVFRLHRLYQAFKHEDDDIAQAADKPDIMLGDEAMHRLMSRLRLREPFAAALDTGLTIADSGNTRITYGRPTTDKIPYGIIDWESKHFGEWGQSDWSFGGRLGLLPTMALVKRSDEEVAADDNSGKVQPIHPLFHDAFHWDVNGRFNVHAGDTSELSFLARGGQSQLLTETQAVGTNEAPVSTSLINNGPGRSAWFYDFGPEFRMFDNPLDIVHEDKTYHSPVFLIGAGVRRNSRFRRDGVLSAFSSPEMRWFFRLSISLNKIIDRRAEGDDPKTFSMGFAVEHESPLRRGSLERTVPSGTRIVLTANFDVLSKLRRAAPKE